MQEVKVPGSVVQPAPKARPKPQKTQRSHGLPDFTKESAAAAQKWFEEHPEAPKKNVLTAEGWYCQPPPPAPPAGFVRSA